MYAGDLGELIRSACLEPVHGRRAGLRMLSEAVGRRNRSDRDLGRLDREHGNHHGRHERHHGHHGQAGEDLMLLVDTDVHGYFSDGISAFVNPSTLPSPIDMPRGLLAGDFDGLAPEDLWIWGPSGARLYLGGIDLSVDIPSQLEIIAAAAFEYPSPYAGILLGDEGLFDLAGGPLVGTGYLDSVAAVSTPDEGRFVSAGYHSANWSHIRFRDAQTLAETQAGLRAGHPALLAGDFDGDQRQEVLAVDDSVELILGVFDGPCISTLDLGIQPAAILPAVGDHDSNGDDEFAIITATGEVIIVDVQ
jgi:hypothetical protein